MREGNLEKKIKEANFVHNNFYDYSLVLAHEPKSVRDKVKIICPIHGVFEMSLDNHISKKQKCPKCSGVAKSTTDDFITKCKAANQDKNYDYSKVEYINCKTKVEVICHEKDILGNEHGSFFIRPDHLRHGHGCPKCAHRYLSTEEWVAMAAKVHGEGRYDYSLVEYTNKQTDKGRFICHKLDVYGNEHGVFEQSYGSHLQGCGCPKCHGGVKDDKETFINKAKKIHGDKYSYDSFVYVNAHTKGVITCPIHGDFEQSPTAHLSNEGCPFCKNSVLEDRISRLLESLGLYYERNVYYKNLGKQTIDFWVPQKNLYIECQGEQHYTPTKFSLSVTDEEAIKILENRIELDKQKYEALIADKHIMIYYTDEKTFHCKNVDVFADWYSDKIVFNRISDICDFISRLDNVADIEIPEKVDTTYQAKPKKKKRNKWTYERCAEEAKKYSSKYEMKQKVQSAYNVCVRNGWIDEFFADRKKKDGYWKIKENVVAASRECFGAKDMIKKFGGAYNSARKHGWVKCLEYKKHERKEHKICMEG